MMVSAPSCIPLYFDESEADLWHALQQIDSVNRNAFIKATLRQVLLGESGAEEEFQAEIIPTDPTDKDSEYEQTINHINTLEKEIETFSLEALFTGESKRDAESEGFSEHEQTIHHSAAEPWDHLLNAVIGEEEDLVVIDAILQTVHSGEEQDDLRDEIPGKMISSELQVEVDFESLKVDSPVPSTSFEYLLKHIIGTEEDEVVLKILRGDPEG